jgi:hypothetical protein
LLAAFVLRNHGDKDKFLMELFDNPEVYEAAQYGWEAEPAVAA